MTTATNLAADSAAVGVQAETIDGDVHVYLVQAGATPEKKYEVGVNYLNGGVPSKALELVEEAIAGGHDTSKVRFYWLLALISGRTSRQLSAEDNSRLDALWQDPVVARSDQWAQGIRVVLRLLDSLRAPRADAGPILAQFDHLGSCQREQILRHLDVFLRGPLADEMWQRELNAATSNRFAADRGDRVWMFFEPAPAGPRVRLPAPEATTVGERVAALAATAVFVIAFGYSGWELLTHGSVWGLIGWLAVCAAGYISGPRWLDRCWRAQGQARYALLRTPAPMAAAPTRGFASGVDHMFEHYFQTWVPHGTDRTEWLAATAGVRRQLRDEIVEIYRESRTKAEQVRWLIRHEIAEVERNWRNGTLFTPNDQFSTQPATTRTLVAGVSALALGSLLVISALLRADPFGGTLALVTVVAAGYYAARRWLNISLERRRAVADAAESQHKLAQREDAFARWKDKLAAKPTDQEMATWLDCDKKVLLNRAIRHYGLTRSDMISHAFLETPAESYKRARVRNGPWRYTRYRILVFLLTPDGMRQLTFELDTGDGAFEQRERKSYRYEAVASVQVTVAHDYRQTFELYLVSGQPISFRVADPSILRLPDEDEQAQSDATQDATGLSNTLRVLEGVAAEGKTWIAREAQAQNA
jgi:uncharacterized membrane protein YedE/YeeE